MDYVKLADLNLTFERSGKIFHNQVHSLGKNELAIMIALEEAHALGHDEQLSNLRIGSDELKFELSIEALQIKRLDTYSSTHALLHLQANNEESAHRLWWLADRLSHPGEDAALQPSEADFRIPGRGRYTEEARQERVAFVRQKTGQSLERLDQFHLQADRLTNNIENLVGSVEIPVGLAGPLFFKGEHARGTVFAPLATTEGALVASMSRGASAISRSGGVITRVLSQQMIRVPFFKFMQLASALRFSRWVAVHADEIRAEALKVSKNARLINLEPIVSGRTVNLRFIFETGDAAGQNMTTTCTWQACSWIRKKISDLPDLTIESFMIEGNLNGDKKVNSLAFVSGRGIRVVAEAFLTREHLDGILKVKAEDLVSGYQSGIYNAVTSGQIGININIANTIAAIFTATGQDIASVHESSLGVLNMEASKNEVYISLVLPSLVIGTVGGGTLLPDQNEYLGMLGCAGSGQVKKLAEIIAGFCLALDLSTLSAVMSDEFAAAHEKMGRNRASF